MFLSSTNMYLKCSNRTLWEESCRCAMQEWVWCGDVVICKIHGVRWSDGVMGVLQN